MLLADYSAHISGYAVVWHHDFDSVDEVRNFTWSFGDGGGNDPNGLGTPQRTGGTVQRISTGGVTGAFLRITRPDSTGKETSDWWRPFAPIAGGSITGNGRGIGKDDPAANNSLALRTYTPTQGGGEIQFWNQGGWYGNSQYHGEDDYDGTEYWIRARVRIDPRRKQGINANVESGKLFYFTRTDRSLTDQEIVVESYRAAGSGNLLSMYRSGSPPLIDDAPGRTVHGDQPGTLLGTVGDGACFRDNDGGRLVNCWTWSEDGTWDTILFHVRPGTSTGPLGTENGNEGDNNTLIEVYAAREGEHEYVCIWRQAGVDLPFDLAHGHCALIASIYQNGNNMTEFNHDYDQIIFSQDFIPPPQVKVDGTGVNLAVVCYGLNANQSTSFTNTGFNNFGESDDAALSWQTAFHHDERNGRLHILGKRANASEWRHAHCRISTDIWTDTGASLLFGDFGHIYGNFTIDPETGDLWLLQGTFNNERRPYRYSNGVWALFGTPYGGATESHMNGAAFHPHLFGPNDGALVADMQQFGFIWRRSTGAVTTWGHIAFAGEREGGGVYWPAKNCVLIGGSPVAGNGVLHKLTPNAVIGNDPVVANMGIPPISVRGGSHIDSGNSFGSLHVHPGNHNKILLINTTTQDYYEGTMNGDVLSWSAAKTHPFTTTPRVICSLKAGLGCLMSARADSNGIVTLTLWKPPV